MDKKVRRFRALKIRRPKLKPAKKKPSLQPAKKKKKKPTLRPKR
jgi:hypothetical protein